MTRRIKIGEHIYPIHEGNWRSYIMSGDSIIYLEDFKDLDIKSQEYTPQVEIAELLLKLEEAVRQEETSLHDINAGRSEYDMAVNNTLRIKNNITDLLQGATWS